MSPILCFSELTTLHFYWQFRPFSCVVRSVGSVDSDGCLEELEDAPVNTLSKFLCEVRTDVSQPVVSHELKVYYKQYP